MGIAFLALFGWAGDSWAAVIFQNDIESATACSQVFTHDVDCYGGPSVCSVTSAFGHSGQKAVRIPYPADEAGCVLMPPAFSPTVSLFTRKYEYYDANWSGNWPVGLKTSRYFTTTDWSLGPGSDWAYMSEKLIWQSYEGNPDDAFGRGMNNAIGNLDLESWYQPEHIFGNGLPYIRPGHWYKLETWMVLDSALDACDGTLRVWIDDVAAYDNTQVCWRSTARGMVNGSGWQSMWFGGNYSGATFGGPTQTLYRYIDDVYLSTSLDQGGPVDTTPPASPTGLSVL